MTDLFSNAKRLRVNAFNAVHRAFRFASVCRKAHEKGYCEGYIEGISRQRYWESKIFFDQTKRIYAGRRGFVIGNGPSLNFADLDKLKREICIGANKVYLAFEYTNWRPTYVTVCDKLVWEKIATDIHRYYKMLLIPNTLDPGLCSTRCIQYQYKDNAGILGPSNDPLPFSSDFSGGVFGGCTVTFDNIQFAAHLGLNPIYLIGCDHHYKGEENVAPGVPVKSLANNHFSENYRSPGEIVNPAPVNIMTVAYEVALLYCQRAGIKIYNATRGGHLEVFPRVAFDSLF